MEPQRQVVEAIGAEIEASRQTHIWGDYINALKLISQVVFTRSSGFILELIQNAEDSGLDSTSAGCVEIRINERRIRFSHNGKPFSDTDVKALSGIRSSKKPEKGTLGYLGIGFKSVFKVSDCPEVYSNGFRFKFDREHWSSPNATPWQVIPIWLEAASEEVDNSQTTFVIPFRDEPTFKSLLEELKRIKLELYLFLRWLKTITIIDETSGESVTLQNLGEDSDGITKLESNGVTRRFKFFRKVVEVPQLVKEDRLTQEYRAKVAQREIAIAFALDDDGNMAPSEAGAMYGGVYSFLPLGEAKSGAKFPIQTDFLVQPGRDAINYEARWNHWLLDEVAKLCLESISFFKAHETWKNQFLPAFEFTKSKDSESYEQLFGPKLIHPIETFLKTDSCIPTKDGGLAPLKDVVRLSESQQAIDDLISWGIFKEEELAPTFGNQNGLSVAAPTVHDAPTYQIKSVNRWTLFQNIVFLDAKKTEPNAPTWFRLFYSWLQKYPHYEDFWPPRARYSRRRTKGYYDVELILDSDCELRRGGDVSIPDLSLTDSMLSTLTDSLSSERSLLHPQILLVVTDDNDAESLRGFLTGLAGVQTLNSKELCRESILPKILIASPSPSAEQLLHYTKECQRLLGSDIGYGKEFWVLSKSGEVKPSKQVFLPTEYKPPIDWETSSRYVSGLSFVSTAYVDSSSSPEVLNEWRDFFRAGGVRENPDNGVEEFALNFAIEQLRPKYTHVTVVDSRNFGYDIEARLLDGTIHHIEVKGRSDDVEIELTRNETEAADTHTVTYFLCVVSSIPTNPAMYMLSNPAAPGVGRKEKLSIPVNVWKKARWI